MKKEDLKFGNIIETKNGKRYIYLECQKNDLIDLDGVNQVSLHYYNDDLTRKNDSKIDRDLYAVKIYEDYTLKKVLWERKEFVVSTDEKTILRILPKQFKWIVRSYENILFLYEDKPQKTRYYWESSKGDVENLTVFNYLFEYIKWEDTEPMLIEDLLKE